MDTIFGGNRWGGRGNMVDFGLEGGPKDNTQLKPKDVAGYGTRFVMAIHPQSPKSGFEPPSERVIKKSATYLVRKGKIQKNPYLFEQAVLMVPELMGQHYDIETLKKIGEEYLSQASSPWTEMDNRTRQLYRSGIAALAMSGARKGRLEKIADTAELFPQDRGIIATAIESRKKAYRKG